MVPQRDLRPLNLKPGHCKKLLPGKYLKVAQKGDPRDLKALLREHPEFLNHPGSFTRTLLWEAARGGKLAAVKLLVDAGADVNVPGCYNNETMVRITPYCAARYYRKDAVADFLWTRGPALDVFRAAFLGHSDRVERELAAQPALLNSEDPHDDTYFVPLLSFAVAGGHLDLAARLVNRGAAVAPYSAQLMRLAGRASRRDLVDLLLANGADLRVSGVEIFIAVTDLALLSHLLDKGLSPDASADSSFPPLVYVARGDKAENPDKVRMLLDRGASVNAPAKNGKTALHYAAAAEHLTAMKALLERGADRTRKDCDGQTPHSLALAAGKKAACELLANYRK